MKNKEVKLRRERSERAGLGEKSGWFWLTLQHVHINGPVQSHTVSKFQAAYITSPVFFSSPSSRQRQISLFKVWCGNQSCILFCLPDYWILQREEKKPLRIRRNEARVWLREEVPVSSLDAHSLDLFPGDLRGNGTRDGESWGFGCVLGMWQRWGKVCAGRRKKT